MPGAVRMKELKMKWKIIVFVLAAAVSASVFCLASCAKEVETLGDGQTQQSSDSDFDIDSENNDADDGSSADGTTDDGEAGESQDSFLGESEEEDDISQEESGEQSGCVHALEYVDYVAATCVVAGNKEYWHCSICDGYFLDGDAAEEVTADEIVIPADGSSHTGEWKVISEPSCVAGERELICTSCGDTFLEDIEPTGEHLYGEWVEVAAATCKNAGVKERKCKNCDEVQTEEIEKSEHKYVAITEQEPTCTEQGQIVYKCSYCGDEYIEYKEALGHDFISCGAKAATCTEDGWKEYEICTRCNYKPSYTVITATGHSYVDTVVAPTADSEGYTIHTCQNCDYYYTDSITQKLTYTLTYELASDGLGYIVKGLEEGSECTDLVIPDYYCGLPVTEIAAEAFSGNTDIISLTIGKYVTSIGKSAFSGCTNLTAIYYNAVAVKSTYINVFRNAGRDTAAGITLYVGAAVISIPANLFTAANYSTTSANITEIVFAENGSLKTIGAYAFAGCDGLKSLYIPSTCTNIYSYAFMNCTSLTYVEVPESAEYDKEKVFFNVTSLQIVTYTI